MKSLESGPIPLAIEAPKTIQQRATISLEEIIRANPDEIAEMRRPELQGRVKDQREIFIDNLINATPHEINSLRKKEDNYIVPPTRKKKGI